MTKGELLKFLEPFDDEIEIDIEPQYIFIGYGKIIDLKKEY